MHHKDITRLMKAKDRASNYEIQKKTRVFWQMARECAVAKVNGCPFLDATMLGIVHKSSWVVLCNSIDPGELRDCLNLEGRQNLLAAADVGPLLLSAEELRLYDGCKLGEDEPPQSAVRLQAALNLSDAEINKLGSEALPSWLSVALQHKGKYKTPTQVVSEAAS